VGTGWILPVSSPSGAMSRNVCAPLWLLSSPLTSSGFQWCQGSNDRGDSIWDERDTLEPDMAKGWRLREITNLSPK
jgi:hypothetical protein